MKRSIETFICNIVYSPLGNKMVTLLGIQRLYAELHTRSIKKGLFIEARNEFNKGSALGTIDDYKHALEKHWVSYSEYANQYEFYNKSEAEREEYISRLKMAYFYWRYTPGVAKAVFRNKIRFLKTFSKNIHRKWIYTPEASYDDFVQMVSNYDCIIKPCDGKLGKGIFKTYKDEDHKDDRKLFESCVKNRMLVEQCVEACDELKVFHPQSLNTIRVVTISNGKKAEVFGSFLRTGVGNKIVDNAHAGGIFAQINVQKGVIESDGINTSGAQYKCHPDSNVVFKGVKIPKWETIVETCCEAAKQTKNPITGWDVAIDNFGNIEFIEGNYGPDFDVMQSPLKIGVKRRIYDLIKEYCGIELR